MGSTAINQHLAQATGARAKMLGLAVLVSFVLPWASIMGTTVFSWKALQYAPGMLSLVILTVLALGICMFMFSQKDDMSVVKKAQILGGLGAGFYVLLILSTSTLQHAPGMQMSGGMAVLDKLFFLAVPALAFGTRLLSLDGGSKVGKLTTQISAGLICLYFFLPIMGKMRIALLIDMMEQGSAAVVAVYLLVLFAASALVLVQSFTGGTKGSLLNTLSSYFAWYWGGLFAIIGVLVIAEIGMVILILFWIAIWLGASAEMAVAGGLTLAGASASDGDAATVEMAAPAAPEPPAASAVPTVPEASAFPAVPEPEPEAAPWSAPEEAAAPEPAPEPEAWSAPEEAADDGGGAPEEAADDGGGEAEEAADDGGGEAEEEAADDGGGEAEEEAADDGGDDEEAADDGGDDDSDEEPREEG